MLRGLWNRIVVHHNSLPADDSLFLTCTKNTELTRAPIARTFSFTSRNKSL